MADRTNAFRRGQYFRALPASEEPPALLVGSYSACGACNADRPSVGEQVCAGRERHRAGIINRYTETIGEAGGRPRRLSEGGKDRGLLEIFLFLFSFFRRESEETAWECGFAADCVRVGKSEKKY